MRGSGLADGELLNEALVEPDVAVEVSETLVLAADEAGWLSDGKPYPAVG